MRTSIHGMLAIAHHEGVVTSRYKDSVGVWTIGIGATKHALPNSPFNPEKFTGEIPVDQAFTIFQDTLKRYEDGVNRHITREMPQHVFDAFVSIHYNCGCIGRATFAKMYNAGRSDEDVANSIMAWNKPSSIIPRRRAEKRLFLHGEYGPLDIPLYTADSRGRVQWGSAQTIQHERAVALLEAPGKSIA